MADVLAFPELERIGRLGNQLFEIAGTVGLARRHGMEPRFPSRWSYRPYFSVPDEYFADEPGLHPCSLPDVEHLDPRTRIYLQDPSLWADIADEVRAMFARSETAEHELSNLEPLHDHAVLHVRRGDNLVQQDFYPVASLAWWSDAAARIAPQLPLRIVSDDVAWCEQVLAPEVMYSRIEGHVCWEGSSRPRLKEHEPGYWGETPTDWRDLFRLAECSGPFVISNSTFGWWGAWLSGAADVSYQWPFYGPRLDVANGGYCDASLMFPPTWRRLPL